MAIMVRVCTRNGDVAGGDGTVRMNRSSNSMVAGLSADGMTVMVLKVCLGIKSIQYGNYIDCMLD